MNIFGGGYEVCIVEEPGSDDPEKSTPAANELRRLIKNGDLERAPEINLGLFSAARGEIWREKIKPALDRGAIVLSARNYYSSLAYQGRGEGTGGENAPAGHACARADAGHGPHTIGRCRARIAR